jgi:DNA repair exonuclease SbcCD nuclease subunit
MFDDLQAAIMGHVHPHQIIRKNPLIAYVGQMEARDFGEGKYDKYLLMVEYSGNKLLFNFEKLPSRPIYDIIIDQTEADGGKVATQQAKNYLENFSNNNNMIGSIVRITIMMNEKSIFDFNKDNIRRFLRKELLVHHCVGIYPQIVSKRQLRKSTITESLDLEAAFGEFLELEEDLAIKERMREIGMRIIRDRRK